jgi:lipopolysaccharide export system protein LptA
VQNKAAKSLKAATLWHVQAAKLTFWDAENRAHLSQNVVVQAPEQKMSGQDLDLYFSRANGAGQGAQQISRAVGTGGVTVVQGDRRATAERGEYTAADGKFVMSGGTPTIFDASEGSTTGRQLTFFLADATIIVDSENGSRTLTKHRVEK